MTAPVSIYLHIPFCAHRCAYCDFNTYAGQEQWIPAYVAALCREIEYSGGSAPERLPIHTVFFGGGTPSLLSPLQLDQILCSLRKHFELTREVEITMEANPGTVSQEDLFWLRETGINRISFGVQSANREELRMLERIHDFFEVIEAVKWARQAGFDNLNLDLIYGLPEQKMQTWQSTVQRVLELHPEHISAYALTLEHGTPFGRWAAKGLMASPDPDLAADMYEWAAEQLEGNGYHQYEISNWAREGRECQHNLQYWRGRPYLAFGAGGHGYANGYRYSNVLRIKTYIERLSGEAGGALPFPLTPVTVNQHRQSIQDDMGEFMMTGLRLTREGISAEEFETRFGQRLEDTYGRQIEMLERRGLLERDGERLRLTKRGKLLGNQVFMEFIG
jgi:oxygen-independent coproporphyrinogen-3 oxidase